MIEVFPNLNELNNYAAEKITGIARQSIAERGRFAAALAGGSTPKSLYRLLASDEYKTRINWANAYFFFGDERNVLPGDEMSNYRMANENLFEPLNVNDKNVFRWQTELRDAPLIAEDYEKKLNEFFEADLPQFDLILLGMGDDGHTASLFPGTEALFETKRYAVANPVEKLSQTRLTLTFPVINLARNVIFLVKGDDKAETLRAVLGDDFQPENFPSQSVKLVRGELFWLVDREAARLLS